MNELVDEFFNILDSVECSDEGVEFHPVFISSCRDMKSKRIDELFSEMRKIVNNDKEVCRIVNENIESNKKFINDKLNDCFGFPILY